MVKFCNTEELNSKQENDESRSKDREETGGRHDGETGRTSTTTTALTRTTTTTVSLPEDTTTTSQPINREPPIIVLQEAPVAPRQSGLLDAAAAAVWIERQRVMNGSQRGTRVTTNAPMSRRERLNMRRQQAAGTSSTPWNDPLTGVLLCPEALEHIVVHSSIAPDHNTAAGPSTVSAQSSK